MIDYDTIEAEDIVTVDGEGGISHMKFIKPPVEVRTTMKWAAIINSLAVTAVMVGAGYLFWRWVR